MRLALPSSLSRDRFADLAVVALVMSVVVYRFSHTVADPDLWGHVKFGQTVWETGRVSQPDPFSYVTGGALWVNHEWLAEVVYFLLFTAFGPTSLIAMKLLVTLAISALVLGHLVAQGVPVLQAGALVLLVMHFFLISLITARPLIVSYLLFLLVLLSLHAMSFGQRWRLWTLPPLFMVWANLHPGFLAGLGILGIWSAVELTRRWLRLSPEEGGRPSAAAILGLTAASAAATALNPYGVELWWFLYHTATVPRPDIKEWQPLVLMTRYGLAYFLFVAVAAMGLLYSQRQKHEGLLAVLAVCALLPLVAIRHTPISALAIAVIAGRHMADAADRLLAARSRDRSPSPDRHWLAAAAVAGAVLFLALSVPNFGCIRIEPAIGRGSPAQAIGLIKESGVQANLAIHFDWGLYAIYHLSPAVKVSLDGRRETGYRPEVYLESFQFVYGQGAWDTLLTKYDTELVLVPTGSAAFNLMRSRPGWQLLHEDPLAGLFGRDDHPASAEILGTTVPSIPYDGAGLCFP
jgi:hypothetical protein